VRLSGRDSTLYVDIVVKELNLAVECHGRQHFEFVPHFHGSRDNFARARERDAAKAAGLVEAGFTFLVIRFDEEEAMEMSHLLARITQAISETTE
jgi:very-short-patch-repair endonuclease